MANEIYAQDGVDITLGDKFSSFAGQICRSTWESSPFVRIYDYAKHFRGPRGYRFKNVPRGYFEMAAPDGIGTKVVIITAGRTHRLAPRDGIAMCTSDITRWGGYPAVFANVFDVETLGASDSETYKLFGEAFYGLREAAQEIGLVLLGGETAELGACVGSEDPQAVTKFNWACFAIGFNHPRKVIDGSAIRAGDIVVALQEDGFRSNGISSVRKALFKAFGTEWWKNPEAQTSIKAAGMPSVLYDKLFAEANGWFDPGFRPLINLTGIFHISGGGIVSKFAEDILFQRGLSANLTNLWNPPRIMQLCGQWREMPVYERYKNWNGGQGMLTTTHSVSEADDFIELAELRGFKAIKCGEVTATPKGTSPSLALTSTYDEDRGTVHQYHQ